MFVGKKMFPCENHTSLQIKCAYMYQVLLPRPSCPLKWSVLIGLNRQSI